MSGSEFVVHRLRAKPVEYTIRISHYVSDGLWTMRAAAVDGVDVTKENMLRVAADLRTAAKWIEEDFDGRPNDDNAIPPNPDASQTVTLEPQ